MIARQRSPENKAKKVIYSRAYHKANREKILAQQRVYRSTHLEEITTKQRLYRETNKEKIREYKRAWAKANPDIVRARYKRWLDSNRERSREYAKQYNATHVPQRLVREGRPENVFARLVNNAVSRARLKDMESDRDALLKLVSELPTNCRCCGKTFLFVRGRGKGKGGDSPSIDRIDNSEGYSAGNIAVICLQCNNAKRDLSVKDLNMLMAYMTANA